MRELAYERERERWGYRRHNKRIFEMKIPKRIEDNRQSDTASHYETPNFLTIQNNILDEFDFGIKWMKILFYITLHICMFHGLELLVAPLYNIVKSRFGTCRVYC